MTGALTPERRARLVGSASAAGALTIVVWVPLFIGPNPLVAALVFVAATLAVFGAVELAAAARSVLDRTRTHVSGPGR